jgi:hypothetical protein
MPQLLYLDSAHRMSGTSSDFAIQLPALVSKATRVSLLAALVPNTVYNITSSNNVIPITISGTTYNATLTAGKYSAGNLATEMQTKMSAAVAATGATFAVSISVSSFLCTITCSTTCTINFGSSSSPWAVLGFPNASTGAGTTFTGTRAVQLNRPAAVFINVRDWNQSSLAVTGTGSSRPTFIVPMSNDPGNVSTYSTQNDFRQTVDLPGLTFGTLRIAVTDNDNNTIELNGGEWSCLLEIESA